MAVKDYRHLQPAGASRSGHTPRRHFNRELGGARLKKAIRGGASSARSALVRLRESANTAPIARLLLPLGAPMLAASCSRPQPRSAARSRWAGGRFMSNAAGVVMRSSQGARNVRCFSIPPSQRRHRGDSSSSNRPDLTRAGALVGRQRGRSRRPEVPPTPLVIRASRSMPMPLAGWPPRRAASKPQGRPNRWRPFRRTGRRTGGGTASPECGADGTRRRIGRRSGAECEPRSRTLALHRRHGRG